MHSLIIKSRSSNFTEYKKVKRSLSEKIIESKISKKTKNEINESMIKKQNINLKEYKIIKRKRSLWNSIFSRKRQKNLQ